MTELRKIETGQSLVFDALVGGAVDAPLVLLLHGFAESLHTWRTTVPA
jgi:pimeloyl-ACP methyl ester carboxylesterase